MKLTNISIEFTTEELEALHYALNLGLRWYDKNTSKCANNWMSLVKQIKEKLPVKMRFQI